jgi:hypothetical protein
MVIDKNIYTTNFYNWVKELKSEKEGNNLINKSTLSELIILYERTTGKSSFKNKKILL